MLFDLFDAAQLDEGRAPRVLRSHARPDLRFGVMLDVGADFITELVFSCTGAQHVAQHGSHTRPQTSHAPSKTFSTAVVMDFQYCFSLASCFCPAFVIA